MPATMPATRPPLLLLGFVLLCLLARGLPAVAQEPALEVTGHPASAAFVAKVASLPEAGSLEPGQSSTWAGRMVRNLALPELPAEILAFSDHPERVRSRGLLFQGGLLAFKPVRFQYYHEGGRVEGPLYLSVRLFNPGRSPARVHLVQGAGGPDADYFGAGHANNLEFLRRLAAFEGVVVHLAPGEVRQVALHRLPFEQVVSGTAQMTLLEGSDVGYALFAVHDPDEPVGYDLLSSPVDVHARGFYPAADQALVRGWRVGPEPGYVAFGAVRQPDLMRGPELKGDYGVLYRLDLRLENPADQACRVEFLFNPRGGQATGTFLARLEGEEAWREWAPSQPVPAMATLPLAVLDLPARGTRTLTVWTMPEGASNYPVRLVFRRAPEVPPGP